MNLPGWLTFASDTRTFSGTPLEPDTPDAVNIEVTASDGKLTGATTFTLTVAEVNDAPAFDAEATDQTATEDTVFGYTAPAASDPEAGTLTYTANALDGDGNTADLPGWLTFAGNTRSFSGTPLEADTPATLSIRVTASDDGSPALSATTDFALTVTAVNDPPAFDAEATDQTATEDTVFSYQVPAATDPEGGALTYTATAVDAEDNTADLPDWLAFTAGTRTFSGTPLESDTPDAVDIRVTASDGALSDTADFTITVTAVNDAPAFDTDAADQTATEDTAFSYQVPAATDPEGGEIAYSAALAGGGDLPGWLAFDTATRTFSGTPLESDTPDAVDIRVTASDGALSDTADFTLTVTEVNDAPAFDTDAADQTATEDTAFSYQVPAATDPEGGDIAYSAALSGGGDLPGWLTFAGNTRTFSGTPLEADTPASIDIRVTASDGALSDTADFTLTVTEVNDAPAFDTDATDQTATEDTTFSYQVPAATDPEGADIAYSAALSGGGDLPGWLTFAGNTRTFSGTPLEADTPASIDIRVTASDGALSDTADFTLTVTEVNDAPAFDTDAADQTATEDTAFSYQVPAATDPEGGALTYTATALDGNGNAADLPGWLTFTSGTRTFSGTPLESDTPATVNIRVAASDGSLSDTTSFTLTVTAVNDAPAFESDAADQTATEDIAFSYQIPAATDPEGGSLTYTAASVNGEGNAVNLPDWLTFAGNTRTFSGTPLESDTPATVNIRVTASDGALTDTTDFTLTVTAVNDAPAFESDATDQTATEDTAFSYQVPAASDPEGGGLTYTATAVDGNGNAVSLPGWLTFTAGTRTFSGTPLEADTPDTVSIRVTASDGTLSVTTGFTLTVTAVNDAPAFESDATDQTATEDTAFSYQVPAATDPEGTALTYTATAVDGNDNAMSLPDWLTFTSGTRTFSGTPLEADTPDAVDIRVTASDGTLSDTTDFTLTVVEVNSAPAFQSDATDQTATEDTAFSYQVPAATDPEGGDIAYSAALAGGGDLPGWLTFTGNTRTFSGTPLEAHTPDTVNIRVTASDGALSDATTFTLTVTAVNDAPAFQSDATDQTATEDTAFSYQVPAASDPEGGGLTYTATALDAGSNAVSLPGWLTFTAGTRTFSGTPLEADTPDTVSIRVTASDGTLSDTTDFTLTVVEVNSAPAFQSDAADQTATEDTTFSYQVPAATDPEGTDIAYSAALDGGGDLPGWLAFAAGTRTFSGTPRESDTPATLDIEVTASDGALTDTTGFTLTVVEVNSAPAFQSDATDQTATEDTAFSYQVPAATDPEGADIAYSAALSGGGDLPGWLTFAGNTRTFSGTPTEADTPASLSIEVTASDGALTDTTDFTITVTAVNDAPAFDADAADQTATEDIAFSYQIPEATDSEGGALTYTATALDAGSNAVNLPGWLTFTAGTRTFSGTPLEADTPDTVSIRVTASDGTLSDTTGFTLTVTAVNDAPAFESDATDQTATEDTTFSYQVPAATDPEGADIAYSAALDGGGDLPGWLAFAAGTRTFSGTPTEADTPASLSIEVTASDGALSDATTFTLTVTAVNDAPAFDAEAADQTATEDTAFSYQVPAATDPEGADIAYSAALDGGGDLPGWLAFDTATRTFSGTPGESDTPATVNIRVAASDGALSDATTFTLTVTAVNDAPAFQSDATDQTATEDTAFSYQVPAATDSEGGALTYTATALDAGSNAVNLPGWLTFTAGTRTFSGTPLEADTPATVSIRVTASDGTLSDTTGFTLTVTAVNDAPAFESDATDQTATEDTAFSYQVPAATDPEGADIAYSAALDGGGDLPGWLTFDTATRTFSGTPGESDTPATVNIRVAASDGALSDATTFTLTVTAVNDAPAFQSDATDQTATEDTAFSYTAPAASDPEGGGLTYTATALDAGSNAVNLPGWLTFTAGTRTFSGTPLEADTPDAVDIRVTASDGTLSDTTDFTLTVVEVNSAPAFQSDATDQTATEDTAFSYTAPAATDPEGADIAYSAALDGGGDLPGWLTFTSGTRTFSGTPRESDTPATVDIVVTASDGALTDTTDFTITVTAVNDAPAFDTDAADQTATEDTTFSYQVPAATDPEGADIAYSAALSGGGDLPGWLTFAGNTRTFSGTPLEADTPASIDIRVTASDGALSDTADFTLTVTEVNDAPAFESDATDQTATEDTSFSYQVPAASDPEGGGLTYTATAVDGNGNAADLPGWLTFAAGTRTFSGTPLESDTPATANIRVAASDGSLSDTTSFTLTVTAVNDAPAFESDAADQTATEDIAFSYQIPAATDPEGGSLTYTAASVNGEGNAVNLPDWLTFAGNTRTFSGTPLESDTPATVNIRVTASDGALTDTTDFTLTVTAVNDAPAFESDATDQTATEDTAFSYQVPAASDPEGGGLTYTATAVDGNGNAVSLPGWLTFTAGTRTFSGTPLEADTPDAVDIRVTASDGTLSDTTDFTLTVVEVNSAPAFQSDSTDQTATEDTAFSYQVPAATDPEGGSLTYTATAVDGNGNAVNLPGWLTFTAGTRTFSGTPLEVDTPGTVSIRVTASDGTLSDTTGFTLTVTAVNDAPAFQSDATDQTATEDTAFSYTAPAASDPEGGGLTYTATALDAGSNAVSLPGWLTFTAGTRTFSGTPLEADSPDAVDIRVTASDGTLSDTTDFTLTVTAVNDAPAFDADATDQTATEDTEFSYQVPAATDPEGADIAYSAALSGGGDLPGWLTFAGNTRTFYGTPTEADTPASLSIEVTASDGALTDTTDFTITVTAVNDAPAFDADAADQTATEDIAFSYQIPEATDSEGGALTYTATALDAGSNAVNLPGWLTFTAGTRTFSGTPLEADTPDTVSIRVTASDGTLSDTTGFTLTVTAVNDAPAFESDATDQTATEDTAFSYQVPAATDPEGGALTYTATALDGNGNAADLPGWLTFTSGTRTFSGTPLESDTPATVNLRVAASDGSLSDTTSFTLTVTAVNDAPAFESDAADQTATEDTTFSYQVPAATDPEGGDIAYSAALDGGGDLPGWLAFAAGTRTFSGTPRESDTPATLDIEVTASDGALTDTTDFTLTVTAINDAPAFDTDAADQTATEDTAFSYTAPAATDPEGADIAYSAALDGGGDLPGWLTFTSGTRTFSGTPRESDTPATVDIVVTASDGALTDTTDFTITVTAVNDAPAFDTDAADQTATEDTAFSYQVPTATDPEGGDIAYSAALAGGGDLPGWLAFDTATRTFSGTPLEADTPDAVDIRVTASDGTLSDTTDFTLTVVEVNSAPAFQSDATDQTATEDTAFSYQVPAATDPEGADIAYSAALSGGGDLPGWLTFAGNTRTFSGTPLEADTPASIDIRVTASDGALSDTADFTLTVTEVNDAPAFDTDATDQTATEDTAFSYQVPAATDPEGGDIAYSAALDGGGDLPGWLTFTSGTRTFSGTPLEADTPDAVDIRVTASDGTLSAATRLRADGG